MKHPMQEMIERRRAGEVCGIPSYCTANELALEAALIRAKAACALTMNEEEREKSYSRSLQRVFEDMKNITRGRGGNA